jgi:preprotein translocase subunit SecF
MFGVVLVGTYTSVFIAAPVLIYLGVGTSRMATEEEPRPGPSAARTRA